MTEPVDVAIVGGGPAGLAAAIMLRRLGVPSVCVLERETEAGGVPRHCAHPPYGLREFGRLMTGPAYARRLVGLARRGGAEIRTSHSVLRLLPGGELDLLTPAGRGRLAARRVILATGAREASRASRLLSGDRPVGVLNTGALQAFIHLNGLLPFRRPVILGTELVALSAIATCRRHGIRPAAVVEANPGPTARWPLALFPRLLGIPVHYGAGFIRLIGSPRVAAVTFSSRDGSRRVACDGVLLTGRFTPEAALVRDSHLNLDPATGGPVINQFGRCSDPAYFAAGNILRPVETAGWCYREANRIAAHVAADLRGGLPAATGTMRVGAGAGVKLVVPQRLAGSGAAEGTKWLEIRAAAAINGHLRVLAGGRTLWERPIAAAPERRILIPLRRLRLDGVADLTVEIA